MAKGRKLTTSRSELLLGSYGYVNGGHETVNDSSELGEADVWQTVDETASGDEESAGEWMSRATTVINGDYTRRRQDSRASADTNGGYTRQRPDPRAENHRRVGGLSFAFDDSGKTGSSRIVHQIRGQDGVGPTTPRGRHMATSAPVNVPDWSKIYRVDSVESLHDSDDGVDENDSEMIPPHEYLAREYARRTSTNSVFEGVGRTLKGRDLSRVRDAVWSQTGFDG